MTARALAAVRRRVSLGGGAIAKAPLAIVLIALAAPATAAQEPPTATLDLGMDAAMPGEEASLLIVLSTTGGPKLGSMQFDVIVPVRVASFVEVAKRQGAESAGADLKAEVVQPERGAGESIVRVAVSASRPIPDGVLLALTFNVSKEAPASGDITMKAGTVAVRTLDGGEIAARAIDGTIAVVSTEAPPVVACFFYMH